MDTPSVKKITPCKRCQSKVIGVNERMRTAQEIRDRTYAGYYVHCCTCGLRSVEGSLKETMVNWNTGVLVDSDMTGGLSIH